MTPSSATASNEAATPRHAAEVQERFDRMARAHLQFIARNLRRMGVTDEDVDDACQEVLLVIRDKLHEVAEAREQSFLYGVILRVASHARRSTSRRLATRERAGREPLSPGATPEQLLQQMQERALLDTLLDELSSELRSVFVLFELEELSTAQIAEMLDLPLGTVKTRLRRARQMFLDAGERHQRKEVIA